MSKKYCDCLLDGWCNSKQIKPPIKCPFMTAAGWNKHAEHLCKCYVKPKAPPKYRAKCMYADAKSVRHLLILINGGYSKLPDWCKKACETGQIKFIANYLLVDTKVGVVRATEGDVIVCINDKWLEVYSSHDEFNQKYEYIGD